MDPYGKTRECRDSDTHPVSVPIAVILDMTGSMQEVPRIVQANLNKLMGTFLDQKASGKLYLGDGYPAVLIGAVDDFDAMRGERGTFQSGQFESGLEIDNDLGKLWFTGNGGGNNGESYHLAMYFLERHTIHDHFQKRGRKGYVFLIGDEPWLPAARKDELETLFGDKMPGDIPTKAILQELEKRYHVYFIMPNLTSHWGQPAVEKCWRDLLGERFVKLQEPAEICTLIASLVAMNEGRVSLADLAADGIAASVTNVLAVIPPGGQVAAHGAGAVGQVGMGGVSRLK